MKLRFAIVLPVAMLVSFSAMLASPGAEAADAGDKATPAMQHANKAIGDTIIQIAAVTQEIAQLASTTAIVAPRTSQSNTPAETASPTPVAKSAAPPAPSKAATAKPVGAPGKKAGAEPTKEAAAKHAAKDKLAEKTSAKARRERLAAAEAKPMMVRCVGKSETGSAAWYGGRYVGRRTSSGERLDRIHATAAHRTLPLNSLARVTNLHNGRSVIVRVTDRGPVSESLLIDMSPRAAEQLAMLDAGIVPVRVEQVVEVASDDK
jgi:rare lipoprotein A